jgi:hypothetical protein
VRPRDRAGGHISAFNLLTVDTEQQLCTSRSLSGSTTRIEVHRPIGSGLSFSGIVPDAVGIPTQARVRRATGRLELTLSHPTKARLHSPFSTSIPDVRVVTTSAAIRAGLRSDLSPLQHVDQSKSCSSLGRSVAGKTALSKMLTRELHSQGHVPVLARGSDLKSRPRAIRHSRDATHSESTRLTTPRPISALPKTRRILVIDDYLGMGATRDSRALITKFCNRPVDRVVRSGSSGRASRRNPRGK